MPSPASTRTRPVLLAFCHELMRFMGRGSRLNVMPDDVRHFEQSLTLEELLILRQQISGSHHD
jgi:hypothetical protein